MDNSCGVVPNELDTFADVLPGGTEEGYICYSVPEDQLDGALLRVGAMMNSGSTDMAMQ